MTVLDTIKNGKKTPHPVDEIPPFVKLFPLGLQHVLAMYAGAVAVPLIVGGAMVSAGELDEGDIVHLIMADLFVAGIATLLQSVGFWRFGVRLPLMQGVTFAAVGPMITIGTSHGITAIYGAVIASGVFMIVMAPVVGKLIRFFPPLVTGTIIVIIGISLMRVAAGWFGGGTATGEDFGDPQAIAFGFGTLVLILAIERFAPDSIRRVSVLLGLIIGTLVSIPFGMPTWDSVGDNAWIGVPQPFQFGMPEFELSAIISMIIVAIVIMTETTGDIVAVGEIVDKKITPRRLADGMRADGAGTVLGGIFNTFPYTSFSQNVGLVGVTGVRSRYVCVAGGVIMVLLGMLPKMAAFVEAIPQFVLGGAGLVMFGMVAATGIRILSTVDYKNNRNNLYIVALAIGFGLIPLVAPRWSQQMAHGLHPLLESGILLTAIAAVLLNLFFNGAKGDAAGAIEAAKTAEAH